MGPLDTPQGAPRTSPTIPGPSNKSITPTEPKPLQKLRGKTIFALFWASHEGVSIGRTILATFSRYFHLKSSCILVTNNLCHLSVQKSHLQGNFPWLQTLRRKTEEKKNTWAKKPGFLDFEVKNNGNDVKIDQYQGSFGDKGT